MIGVGRAAFSFFEFDGITSGLALPPIDFPHSGYTIAFWMKIESFEETQQKPSSAPTSPLSSSSSPLTSSASVPIATVHPYEPHLYCLMTKDGFGLEAYFSRGVLFFRSNEKGASIDCQPTQFIFERKKWYSLCVVHSKTFFGGHSFRVYIDGQLVLDSALKYPKLTEVFLCFFSVFSKEGRNISFILYYLSFL